MKKLVLLILIFCFQGLTVYGQSIGELKRKAEIQKLKADNYPKSELFFGANLNSNFGTVESTNNTINLESVSMEFDNFIPSFRVGYKYLLNPEKHHGLFFHFNRSLLKKYCFYTYLIFINIEIFITSDIYYNILFLILCCRFVNI